MKAASYVAEKRRKSVQRKKEENMKAIRAKQAVRSENIT
jgi:hypothetical protein